MEPDGIDLTVSPSPKNSARQRPEYSPTSRLRRSPRKHSGSLVDSSSLRRSPHKKSRSRDKSYQYNTVPSPFFVQKSYNPYTKKYKKPVVLLKSNGATPRDTARRDLGLELKSPSVELKEPPELLGLRSTGPNAALSSDLGLELKSPCVELKKPPELLGSFSTGPAAASDVPAQKELPKFSLQNGFPTCLYIDGRQYNKNYVNKAGTICTYRCKNYRQSKNKNGGKCKAKIEMSRNGSSTFTNEHHDDPACALNNMKKCGDMEPMMGDLHDASEEMKRFIDFVAIADVTATADEIARQCLTQILAKYGRKWTGLSVVQAKTRVQNTRSSHGITGTRMQIDKQLFSSKNQSFLRSQKKWIDPKAPYDHQEVWTFGKQALLDRLKNKQLQVFIDGTFALTPKPFYQTLVLMIYDTAYDYYVPIWYALLTGKTESCYRVALTELVEDLGGKFDPATIGVDFELALRNVVSKMFPKALVIGCLFHWKQAIRRKMVDLGIPKAVISHFMRPGHLDLLTVLPKEDVKTINCRGFLFVAEICESGTTRSVELADKTVMSVADWVISEDGKNKMTNFWAYMSRQWVKKKGMLVMWNLHEIAAKETDIELASRTANCALEGFNRIINESLKTHSSLLRFVNNLDNLTDKHVEELELLRTGSHQAREYDKIPFPTIPESYEEFVPPPSLMSLAGEVLKMEVGSPAAADLEDLIAEMERESDNNKGPSRKRECVAEKPAAEVKCRKKSKCTTATNAPSISTVQATRSSARLAEKAQIWEV